MDRDELLALFDRQMRRNARPDGPGARIEQADGVVRQVCAAEHGWHGILWSGLDEATADGVIRAQVAHFTALGREFEWKLYSHDRPADLAGRLRAAGFVPEPAETLMVAPVSALSLDAGPPEGVRLQPVTDAAGVDLLTEVHEQAFGTPGNRLRERLLEQLAQDPDRIVAVLALAGDRPVSSARMEFCPGTDFAGLWGGGTVPEWQGRGIYRALIAHRARIAGERGVRYLQVDASDQSRPILERLGFTALSVTTPWVFSAP